MPPKPPQEDRPYDYAPYTPYDRERWVRVFYVRYSPAANRRHACLYYGSLAVMMVLLLLTLFVHDRGFTLPAAMCQFLSVLYLVYMILLTQHAEKHSWLLTYEHGDRETIKKGHPLYILRDDITNGRVVMFIGLLLAVTLIGVMLWLGTCNLILYFA